MNLLNKKSFIPRFNNHIRTNNLHKQVNKTFSSDNSKKFATDLEQLFYHAGPSPIGSLLSDTKNITGTWLKVKTVFEKISRSNGSGRPGDDIDCPTFIYNYYHQVEADIKKIYKDSVYRDELFTNLYNSYQELIKKEGPQQAKIIAKNMLKEQLRKLDIPTDLD